MSKAVRKALITGASGFIGGHLARQLVRDGWQVHTLVRKPGNGVNEHLHDGSIGSLVNCMTAVQPDVVFHLASLFLSQHSTTDVDNLIQSNIAFGAQLLEAMKVAGVRRLVNTGTSWQNYEGGAYNPVCLYAATKQAFEALIDYYVQAEGFKVITLRLFDTYGADDPRPKLFHLLRKSAASGETLRMSPGEQLIDLVHVDDVVAAFKLAETQLDDTKLDKTLADGAGGHRVYGVSSGAPMALRDLVARFCSTTGERVDVQWGGRPYREREVMQPWQGEILPTWTPLVSLEEGLRTLASTNNSTAKDASQ